MLLIRWSIFSRRFCNPVFTRSTPLEILLSNDLSSSRRCEMLRISSIAPHRDHPTAINRSAVTQNEMLSIQRAQIFACSRRNASGRLDRLSASALAAASEVLPLANMSPPGSEAGVLERMIFKSNRFAAQAFCPRIGITREPVSASRYDALVQRVNGNECLAFISIDAKLP